jgi:protein tyrosine/serine phosphatase
LKRKAFDRKRATTVAVVLLVLGGGLGLAYYADHHLPVWHFRTVDEGRFYRTSQLDGEQFEEIFRDYGIKTVINLRHERERAPNEWGHWYSEEARAAQANGVRLLDIPLESGTPPNEAQVKEILSVLDDEANLPVLVHCFHGSIRSAALEGLWRREYMGEDGHRAMRRVESWGTDLEYKYPEIARFIREYVPRRDRKGE